jgi:hypothetical protein
MRSFALIATLFAALLSAQGKKEEPKTKSVQKIFQIKYADPRAVDQALQIFGCCTRPTPYLGVVSVSVPPDVMPLVENAIKQLDVPSAGPQNFEIVAWLISATNADAEGGQIPRDLDEVVKRITSTFGLKHFRLIDTLLLRTRSGERANVSGQVMLGTPPKSAATILQIKSASVTPGEKGNIVHITNLDVRLNPASQIQSDIDIPEGQRVVVGKSSMDAPDKALIVVLTAKVL